MTLPGWRPRNVIARMDRARNVPVSVTDPASRHAAMIARALMEGCGNHPTMHSFLGPGGPFVTRVNEFAHLWDSLNAKRGHGWDANHWVWVIAFRRVEASR